MATVQLLRNRKTETKVDIKTLAALASETCIGSTNFFKKLIALSISDITYHYKIFPEEDYIEKRVKDIPVKVLHSDTKSPEAYQLLQWLKGSFDALEKRYLKQLVFGLSTGKNKAGEVFESFTFNFNYTDKGEVSVDYRSKDGHQQERITPGGSKISADQIFQKAIALFSSNYVYTSSRPPLDGKIEVSIKLYYHEETPANYEPPCFQPSPEKGFKYPNKPTALQLGKVETPWHKFGLLVQTSQQDQFAIRNSSVHNTPVMQVASKKRFAKKKTPASKTAKNSQIEVMDVDVEDAGAHSDSTVLATPEVIEIKSPPERESPFTQESCRNFSKIKPLPYIKSSQPFLTPDLGFAADAPAFSPGHPASGVSTTGSRVPLLHEGRTQCPCLKGETLPGTMLLCDTCGLWQHAICFGLIYENDIEDHRCVTCAENTGMPCTDPMMLTFSLEDRKELCLYRHALALCTEVHRIDTSVLQDMFELDHNTAEILLKKLDGDNVLNKRIGAKSSKGINRAKLTETMLPKYFLCAKKNNDENVNDAAEALQDLTTSPSKQARAAKRNHSPAELYAVACNKAQLSLKLDKPLSSTKNSQKKKEKQSDNSEPAAKKQKVSKAINCIKK